MTTKTEKAVKKRKVKQPDEIIEISKKTKDVAKASKLYFNKDTQIAIEAYQVATTQKERESLYITTILPSFEKLAENLINIHKFTGLHDSYEDLKNDCVNFLFETIHKFDGSRGTNAFSYFNVVAKNWLIIKAKQKNKRNKKAVSFDDVTSISSLESRIIDEYNTYNPFDNFGAPAQIDILIEILYEVRTKVKNENELLCINSIITIFENIDDIDLLNKSAIFLYIREMTGFTPKQLTTTMQNIKKHFRKIREQKKDEE